MAQWTTGGTLAGRIWVCLIVVCLCLLQPVKTGKLVNKICLVSEISTPDNFTQMFPDTPILDI